MSGVARPLATWGLCLGLLTGCVGTDADRATGEHSPTPAVSASRAVEVSAPTGVPYATGTQPVEVVIPSLDIEGSIQPVGMTDAVTMQVPSDIQVVGWFDRSVTPISEIGNTVLVGHRDGAEDPNGIFRRLADVRSGDVIEVVDMAGRSIEYEVDSVELLGRAAFADSALSIFETDGVHQLVLVTCGGDYDRARGGYQANVVVYATRI